MVFLCSSTHPILTFHCYYLFLPLYFNITLFLLLPPPGIMIYFKAESLCKTFVKPCTWANIEGEGSTGPISSFVPQAGCSSWLHTSGGLLLTTGRTKAKWRVVVENQSKWAGAWGLDQNLLLSLREAWDCFAVIAGFWSFRCFTNVSKKASQSSAKQVISHFTERNIIGNLSYSNRKG